LVWLQRSKAQAQSTLMPRRRKAKTGITLKIPSFGDRHIQTLLADYDGTLSRNGEVTEQIKERLVRLVAIDIHILTADRKAKSNECFGWLPVRVHILSRENQDLQKRDSVKDLNAVNVAVFGNGNNDRALAAESKGEWRLVRRREKRRRMFLECTFTCPGCCLSTGCLA
jgi:soluble P-type ATPase